MHRLHALRRRVPGRGDLRRRRRAARSAAVQGAERRAREEMEADHRAQAGPAGCGRVEGREGQDQSAGQGRRERMIRGTKLAVAPVPAQGTTGDAAAGRQKTQMCAGCHGIEGWRTAYPEVYPVPRIAGQHPAYLVKALQAYKSGERSHPSMRAIAASLSDKDMADLAAYYGETSLRTAVK